LLRGTLTGGLAAMALYLCLPHIAQPQEWSSISGNMVMIGMDLFFFAHALSAIAREFLLTTENQWEKGRIRRQEIFSRGINFNAWSNTYSSFSGFIKYLGSQFYLLLCLLTTSKSMEGFTPLLCAFIILLRTALTVWGVGYFSAKISGIHFWHMLSSLAHLLSPRI